MKKIAVVLLLLLTFVTPSFAVSQQADSLIGQTATGSSPSAVKQNITTQVSQTKITDLQNRAKTEITRRLTFLNELSNKISALNKLTDADKTTLKTQIQQQIDGLTTLMSKINSDTDTTTLKADVKSIINGYYIFAFFRVKISLLVAAERLSVATSNMNAIYNKLNVRVTELKNQGKDVTSLQNLLTNMLTNINAAATQYQAAETELGNLSAQGYPGNKSSLTDARSKIKVGAQDLRTAFADAVKIRQGLGNIGGNIKPKTASQSATITPTSTPTITTTVSPTATP